MLKQLIESKAKERKLSSREIAKEVGVSHTTVIRASHGDIGDIPTLMKFAKWLEVHPSTLLNSEDFTEGALANQIAAVLEGQPKLKDVFQNALVAIQEGRASSNIIEDIAAYASFRLGLQTKQS